MIDDSYLESVNGEKQVALYKRLCRNVKGADRSSLRSVVTSEQDLQIKRIIKDAVDKNMSEEKVIGSIISQYNLKPVGGTQTKPKKRDFDSVGVKVEITNILSPKDSKGLITTGASWALEHLENMLSITGSRMQRSRGLHRLIDQYMDKHPELDSSRKVAINFLASAGVVKPLGGNTYKLTEKWKKEIQ